jgi:hypothetical protein
MGKYTIVVIISKHSSSIRSDLQMPGSLRFTLKETTNFSAGKFVIISNMELKRHCRIYQEPRLSSPRILDAEPACTCHN